jgi:3-hydroxyisobutyrate dehydrogenase-like beta-hydroxyacid dehydrogenase
MAPASASDLRSVTVGFVGLGAMGTPMAENIIRGGYRLVVYDIRRDQQGLASMGAGVAKSPAEIARDAATLICMAETTEEAEEAILGPTGFAAAAEPGDVVVLMATIDWAAVKAIDKALAAGGIAFIDAPVAGRRHNGGARGGALKCFAGGDAAALERVRPILETMTSDITQWGAAGDGTAFKLVNSMIVQANRVVAAEALGAKAGLDPARMLDAFARSYANSGALQYLAPRVLARDFDGIPMTVTLDDISLQIALGKALGVPLPMTSQGQLVYGIARIGVRRGRRRGRAQGLRTIGGGGGIRGRPGSRLICSSKDMHRAAAARILDVSSPLSSRLS